MFESSMISYILAVVPNSTSNRDPLGFSDIHHTAHSARDVSSSFKIKNRWLTCLFDIILLTPCYRTRLNMFGNSLWLEHFVAVWTGICAIYITINHFGYLAFDAAMD